MKAGTVLVLSVILKNQNVSSERSIRKTEFGNGKVQGIKCGYV
jgi:hypothetical protein